MFDAPTLLVDPNTLSADGTVAMTAVRVSPDGRYLAYALSEAGSDWRTIRVRDVATGDDLPDELHWTKWIDPTWLPDESGFLYWRYPEPVGGEFTAAMGAGELMLHRLGDDPAVDELVWSRPDAHEWMADPVGGRRRRVAGADQQPGHRFPERGARPPVAGATRPAAVDIGDERGRRCRRS